MKKYIIGFLVLLLSVLISFLAISSKSNQNSVGLGTPIQAPSPNFRYRIKGANSSKLLFEIHYENSYYNYNYELDLGIQRSGKISVAPGPDRVDIEIQMTAVSETGKASKPLTFKTSQWWKRLYYNFIGHTFVVN